MGSMMGRADKGFRKIWTPRGRVMVDSVTMRAELTWNPGFAEKFGDKFASAQNFLESEVIRLSEPYTPFLTGMLIKSATLGTVLGSGVVTWIAPYAKYQYYGIPMGGRAGSKTPLKEKRLKYTSDVHPIWGGTMKRGSYWFERMKENHFGEIERGVKNRFYYRSSAP